MNINNLPKDPYFTGQTPTNSIGPTSTNTKRSISETGSSVLSQEIDAPPLKKHKINIFEPLPPELIVEIAKYLSTKDILALKATCPALDEISNDSKIIESILDARLETCNTEEELLSFLEKYGVHLRIVNLSLAKFKFHEDIPNKVAALCPGLTSLKLGKKDTHRSSDKFSSQYISDFSQLASCEHLENLELVLSENVSSVDSLSSVTTLVNLKLKVMTKFNWVASNINTLVPVASLINLEHLDLRVDFSERMTPLGSLTTLRSLIFHSHLPIDCTVLSSLTKLTTLKIKTTALLSTIPLTPLEDFKGLSDLNPLGSLRLLDSLSISVRQILDLSPLGLLTCLTKLDLCNGRSVDLKPIKSLINLKHLSIDIDDHEYEEYRSLEPLSFLTNLETFFLMFDAINNLSPLSNLTKLHHLSIDSYNITDILPLTHLTNLRNLESLCDNIPDISPISTLTNLERLRLPVGYNTPRYDSDSNSDESSEENEEPLMPKDNTNSLFSLTKLQQLELNYSKYPRYFIDDTGLQSTLKNLKNIKVHKN
jgi:hypothetical protein